MSYGDIIDDSALDALSAMVAGDTAFLTEMIDAFFDEAPGMLALMQSSLVSGEASELRRAAHSLKSNSATFGAMTLSSLCSRLEDLGHAGRLDDAPPLVAECFSEYSRVEEALRRRRQEN